jgi:hypothetical protein
LILVVFGFGRAMRFVETWLTRFSEFLMLDKTLGPHLCCRYQFSFQSAGPRAYCLGTQSFVLVREFVVCGLPQYRLVKQDLLSSSLGI